MKTFSGRVNVPQHVWRKSASIVMETLKVDITFDFEDGDNVIRYCVRSNEDRLSGKECDIICRLLYWACDGRDATNVCENTVWLQRKALEYRGAAAFKLCEKKGD